jgi:hypothetical protein
MVYWISKTDLNMTKIVAIIVSLLVLFVVLLRSDLDVQQATLKTVLALRVVC